MYQFQIYHIIKLPYKR